MTINRGDICANGAVVIDCKRADDGVTIVLCLWVKDTQDDRGTITRKADPYVTWTARRDEGTGAIICQTGHYMDSLSDAVVDFNSRT
jgi:hypothetical protein